MKLGAGCMWRLLLLSLLAAAFVAAHEKLSEDLSDDGDDMGLDEEELRALMGEEEDEATVIDEEESDEKNEKEPGEAGTDPNVSFQVGVGLRVQCLCGVW